MENRSGVKVFLAGMGAGIALAVFVNRAARLREKFYGSSDVDKAQIRLESAFRSLVTSACIHVGDAAGIYKCMDKEGPMTLDQLTELTGFKKRWLEEWLCQAAAAQIITFDSKKETFALPRAYSRLLLPPDDPRGTHSIVGLFQMAPALVARISTLATGVLETGIGQSYDGTHKENIARGIRNLHYEIATKTIRLSVVPMLDDGKLLDCLMKGNVSVAELGCGAGLSICELATYFPDSHFQGLELSKEAIQQARAEASLRRLENLKFIDVGEEETKNASMDFVFCFDVIHDCTDPESVIGSVRSMLKPNGLFLIMDIPGANTLLGKIQSQGAETRLGFSCGLCLHSGTSAADGAALGTIGLHEDLLRDMATRQGFSSVEVVEIPELESMLCCVLRP
mmetsp:Transcript_19730/g.36560  ORF Transcript_19730/g.36560 Transcript_19730/m.36560 type:complete len:396 (+) Transcript_19730:197-1384(+)